MKRLLCFVLFTCFLAPAVFAKDHYISDHLFTYIHTGPSSQFRILGSINAGVKVSLINVDKKSGYSEIIDAKGRRGWVDSNFVTETEGLATRLPALNNELKTLKAQLEEAKKNAEIEKSKLVAELEASQNQHREMEQSYRDINQQLSTSQTENRELMAKLDTQKEDLLLKYFLYGGSVAGLGLLFGLVLPHLIPKRKKKTSDW